MQFITITLVLTVIAVLAPLILGTVRRLAWDENYEKAVARGGTLPLPEKERRPGFRTPALIAGVSWATLVLLTAVFHSAHVVQAGNVGVVYRFGAIVGQTDSGFVLTAPWEELKTANVQLQKETFDQISASSVDTQDVFYRVTLNYRVSPDAVQRLYKEVGRDYYEKLIPARVEQFFKDESVKYDAIEASQRRTEIANNVKARLEALLQPFSITVLDLLIEDLYFSESFSNAIEEKQVASQNALREQERVTQSEAEAAQARAKAQGVADAIVIEAEGQAEANRALAESLTAEVIQYQAVQKLSDNIQIALIPSGQGLILDPATFLSPATPTPTATP